MACSPRRHFAGDMADSLTGERCRAAARDAPARCRWLAIAGLLENAGQAATLFTRVPASAPGFRDMPPLRRARGRDVGVLVDADVFSARKSMTGAGAYAEF